MLEKRREWKKYFWEKEKQYKEIEEVELRSIKNENDVWIFFNKYRKRRERENENSIKEEDWITHLKTLLQETEARKLGEKRRKAVGREENYRFGNQRSMENVKKNESSGYR